MTETVEWLSIEQAISRLLPSGTEKHRRDILLAEISAYSSAVVREARRGAHAAPPLGDAAAAPVWLDKPIFICGHQKTGTTLLQQLLDGHPDIVVLPSEGTYFTSFGYAACADPTSQDIDRFVADWIARFVDPNYAPHFKIGRTGPNGNPSVFFARRLLFWQIVLRQGRAVHAPFTLLLALIAAYKDVTVSPTTPRLWAEKTPLNEIHARRLAQFEHARFIQLVREPSSTLTSLRGAVAGGNFDAAKHIRAIARSLKLAQTNGRRLGSRYLVVRYEDLTDDPRAEMERVRVFLGISPNPSLLVPTVVGRTVRSNSSFERSDFGVIRRSRGAPPLSRSDATLVSAIAGSAARCFGYDVERLPAATHVAVHLRQLRRTVVRRFAAWEPGGGRF